MSKKKKYLNQNNINTNDYQENNDNQSNHNENNQFLNNNLKFQMNHQLLKQLPVPTKKKSSIGFFGKMKNKLTKKTNKSIDNLNTKEYNNSNQDLSLTEILNETQYSSPNLSKNSNFEGAGSFIINDPKKLSELPSAAKVLCNRKPLKKGNISLEAYNYNLGNLKSKRPTLRNSSNSSRETIEPKYITTRTPSNMSLNVIKDLDDNLSTLSLNSKLSLKKNLNSKTSLSSNKSDANEITDFIEIASEREANIRNYEIEQFRCDENNLKEQLNDLLNKMRNLQRTLVELETREMEEVKQKKIEAENFEKETREKIEQALVRKEELDRDAVRLNNRLKELRSMKRETQINERLNAKMRNEIEKCLYKMSKQYKNGCTKYERELEKMENEAAERRNRDRELMEQYKQKQSEFAILLEEKLIIRKSLEERNQLEKLLGQNGINLLVANQKKDKSIKSKNLSKLSLQLS